MKHLGCSYSPFGYSSPVHNASSFVGYLGQRKDECCGGYALGNGYRMYYPSLMRFLSPDGWSPFDDGGMNSYAYCSNDPVNYYDSSGHAPKFGLKSKLENTVEVPPEIDRRRIVELNVIESRARDRVSNGMRGGGENVSARMKGEIYNRAREIHRQYMRELDVIPSTQMEGYLSSNPGAYFSMVYHSRLVALRSVSNRRITPGNLGMIRYDAGWAAAAVGIKVGAVMRGRVIEVLSQVVAALRKGDFELGYLRMDDAYRKIYSDKPMPFKPHWRKQGSRKN